MPAGPAITPHITQLLGPLLANHERIERYRAIAIERAAGLRGRTARHAAPEPQPFTTSAGSSKSMPSTRRTSPGIPSRA